MKCVRWWQGMLAAMALLLTGPSQAAEERRPRRVAVVVGSNAPAVGRSSLRYAHDDARNMADVLVQVGEFTPKDVRVLLDPEPEELLSAMDAQLGALRGQPGETLLLFYYSGHADEKALYPGGHALPLEELRRRIDTPDATVRVGIIDACRGGGWTRAKGLQPEAPFEVNIPLTLQSEGSIFIASSSGLENAHETSALQGSFFTHHLVAGLRGVADQGSDGEVSVVEAFTYARQLTLRDTALLGEGLQHPSFDMNLRGRSDLPLARVKTSASWVEVKQTTGPLSVILASSGTRVLEVPAGKRSLYVALPPGKYLLVRKESGGTFSREFTLEAGQREVLDEASLEPLQTAQLQRKGPAEEEPPRPRNTLTFSPVLMAALAIYGLEYERALLPELSVFVAPRLSIQNEDASRWSYAQLMLGARYFPFGHAPGGLFLTSRVSGISVSASSPTGQETGQSLIAGLGVGYSLLAWNWLVLSVGVTESYFWTVREGSEVGMTKEGFVTDLQFNLGVAF
ncbi:caspase family protein [Archangium lansingense]|uniref:Caspase family protein n=1 Tax=Archangium lansingense TaxID=2995310 RepID=A0ABT4AD58_9BACT|nr:caspase family protein [Archangium lansinium]MCY1079266.1 caspase family protein [Archangium lansinium]